MTNPLKEEAQNHDEDRDIAQTKADTREWLEEQREERGEY